MYMAHDSKRGKAEDLAVFFLFFADKTEGSDGLEAKNFYTNDRE